MPQYELNIRDYIRIFHKRKYIVILTFVLMLIWGIFSAYTQPSVYKSSTTVKILERKSIAGLLTEWIVYDPGDMMASQTKVITGFPIVKKVAWKLNIIDENTPEENVDRIIVGLQGRIETEIIGSTSLIRITATAKTPHGAMDLANTAAQLYIEENLIEKRKRSTGARTFIEEQLSQLEARLREGEESLREFNKGSSDMKLIKPYQAKLVDIEFQLNSLLQKYTAQHPQVQQLQQQINDIKVKIQGFSGDDVLLGKLLREVDVNKKLYAMLKEKLEEARITEAQNVADVTIVDPAVLPLSPVSSQKSLSIMIGALTGAILGVAIAFVVETLDTSVGTIEDVEKLLQLPILGVVPSASHYLTGKHNLLNRLKNKLLRKEVPQSDDRRIRLIVHYDPLSTIADSYRNIRTNLMLNSSQKTILVTSSSPQEGKSTILINLGLTFAQRGLKTLLVASDLRRPVLAKAFGVKRDPGFNEVMSGAVKLDDALKNVSDFMLGDMPLEDILKSPVLGSTWILTSGHSIYNPAELLGSQDFPPLIEELKQRFDIILFDSPPVLSITDASLLTPKVDAVILCYEVGKTARHALLRSKTQLEMVGANIAGVILNHIAPQTETIASYAYYTSKKYSYGPAADEHGPG